MSETKSVILLSVFLVSSVVAFFVPPSDVVTSSPDSVDIRASAKLTSTSPQSFHWILNSSRDAIRTKQSKLMQSYMNASVDPCDNFYDYACGNWEHHNPIPNDKWQYSTTQVLQTDLQQKLKDLLSEPIVGEDPPSAMDKAKLYYKSCMNKEAQAKLGTEPLLKFFSDLGGWPVLDDNWPENEFDWLQLAINTSFVGNGIIIAFDVEKNPTIPTEYVIFLQQTSLGMSNRDNYLKAENSKNLEAYRNFVKKVLRLLNVEEQKAQHISEDIVNFEIQLANATLPMEATEAKQYQPQILNITLLNEAYRYIDWKRYLSGVRGTEISMNQTVVMQLGDQYYENLYFVLSENDKETIANYIIWRCVLHVLINLGDTFRPAMDEYLSSITGQVEPIPQWKICVTQVNEGMGMALSGMFIKKYFDESSKNETIKIINSLKEAFDENLLELDWIDAPTKAYASKKANSMGVAAGYPDFILSEEALNRLYEGVEILEGKHFENYLSITKQNWRKNRDRLLKPFNKNQWTDPPTIVNALYQYGSNRILILASILQPPFFHKHFPHSLNFGAIGTVMGHEVIHAFDDNGRKFDSAGDYFNWWTPKAILNFEERQKCFLEQYENLSMNDRSFKSIATMSENLADNGGLRLAYEAYSKWKQLNDPSIREETFSDIQLNEDQLFFLSFAQLYCAATRPEALIESRSCKDHSPEMYRVIGTLMNFEKFSETFECPIGSRLNPSKRCRLW